MPYIVPSPSPASPTGLALFLKEYGAGIEKNRDLILQAILSGQLAPTARQGQYTTPGGATTPLSPAEVSATNPNIDLSRLLQQQRIPGAQVKRAGFPLQFQPSLTRPLQQAQLEEAQGKVALQKRQLATPPFEFSKLFPSGTPGSPSGAGGTSTIPEGFGLTGIDIDPVTGEMKLKLGQTPEAKARQEAKTASEKELANRRQQTQEGFRRSMGLFTQLMGQFKSKIAAQGGEGGLLPGVAGLVRGKTRAPGSAAIEAFEGQRRETALGLNNIVTGQNRVIKGVVEMLSETLPNRFDSIEFAEQKVSQSIANAFRLMVANNRGILTKDVLEGFDNAKAGQTLVGEFVDRIELTGQEELILQKLIEQVLGTPATQTPGQRATPPFSKTPQGPSRPEGIEMRDANGNRAYVYPDGTIEEIAP